MQWEEMSKRKNRRNSKRFPNLSLGHNLKRRADYMDNIEYVNGVKHKGARVMAPLDIEAKTFLDEFNKEYYVDSFDSDWNYDGIHKILVDKDTVDDLKNQIKELKVMRKKIYDKSASATKDYDRVAANHYSEQIEDIEKFIYKIHPRRECDDMNNARNNDLFNISKSDNRLIYWGDLREDSITSPALDEDKEDDDDYDY